MVARDSRAGATVWCVSARGGGDSCDWFSGLRALQWGVVLCGTANLVLVSKLMQLSEFRLQIRLSNCAHFRENIPLHYISRFPISSEPNCKAVNSPRRLPALKLRPFMLARQCDRLSISLPIFSHID
ncbi:hypothetical protein M758_1G234600 [Ceratodon purpureus]|nr:hypothetical protein M758_1G234600 [Ceratodon purpureus]